MMTQMVSYIGLNKQMSWFFCSKDKFDGKLSSLVTSDEAGGTDDVACAGAGDGTDDNTDGGAGGDGEGVANLTVGDGDGDDDTDGGDPDEDSCEVNAADFFASWSSAVSLVIKFL